MPRVFVMKMAVAVQGIIGEIPVPVLRSTAVSSSLETPCLSKVSAKAGARIELVV